MKILNHKAIADHVGKWLEEKLTWGGVLHTAVLGLSGGVDSTLIALLCKRSNIPLVCVNMPCHSSSWSGERARALAVDYRLKLITVDATYGADAVQTQVDASTSGVVRNEKQLLNDLAGLYSCSRAPILDYVAKRFDGVILGTGNRDEDGLLRYYAKRGDGSVDLSPIADLHKSEVMQLVESLAMELAGGMIPASVSAILGAKPSADLWGGKEQYDEDELGLTYDQVEWVDRFVNTAYGEKFWERNAEIRESIISAWVGQADYLSEANADVIRKVSNMEMATKHKANPNIPVCLVHDAHPAWFV
jgi:NAD+ synthase